MCDTPVVIQGGEVAPRPGAAGPHHEATDAVPPGTKRRARRQVPLVVHVLGLAVVLVVLLPRFGSEARVFSDEGALVAQVTALDAGSAVLADPAIGLDPDQRWFAFPKSILRDGGGVPYPKKVTYPLVAHAVYDVAGLRGLQVLSILGTVLAAAAAAGLAGALSDAPARHRNAVAALWICGLLSPLTIDAYMVFAHTLGAAMAGLAVVGAVRFCRSGRVWWAVAAMASIVAAVLMRNEALLFGVALALGCLVAPGPHARRGRLLGGGIVVASAVGLFVDRMVTAAVVGTGEEHLTIGVGEQPRPGLGGMAVDRLEGALTTLLRPTYALEWRSFVVPALVLVGLVVVLAASRGRAAGAAIATLAVASVAIVAPLGLLAPMVPGLVVAFPLVLWGAVALGRTLWSDWPLRLVSVVGASYVVAVLATQYRVGGAFEWGGRFFALAVPIGSAVAALGLAEVERKSPDRLAAPSLLLASGAMTLLGLSALADVRDSTAIFETRIAAVAQGDAAGPLPVVITEEYLPRLFWRSVLEPQAWLNVPDVSEVPEAVEALRSAGEDRFVIVTARGPTVLEALEDAGAAPVDPAAGTPEVDRLWIAEMQL